MDCIENENVCTVKKENNSGYYRIHTIWKKDGFRVNIASKDGAWAGEMTAENIISMCGILKLEPEKYLAECKEALTTDDGKPGYSYTFENGCFTWKKMIDEDSGIKIRMGSVLVKCVNFIDTIQNILEAAINCKKQLNNQLMNLYQINEMQQQRLNELQIKIEELLREKNFMETDLYGKFLLLLNAKKRKIQELEGLLLKDNTETGTISNIVESSPSKETSSVNAYEMDTEDENSDNASASGLVSGNIGHRKESEKIPEYDEPNEKAQLIGKSNASGTKCLKTVSKTLPTSKADLLDYLYGPGEASEN